MKLILGTIFCATGLFACTSHSSPPPSLAIAASLREQALGEVEPEGIRLIPGSQAELVARAGTDRVFFSYGSAALSDAAKITILRQSEWLHARPAATVTIEGHAGEEGTAARTLAFSRERAYAVKRQLVSLGIRAARLRSLSYGNQQPEIMLTAREGGEQNRRAVLIVSNDEKPRQ